MAAVDPDRQFNQKITIANGEVDGTLTNFVMFIDRSYLANGVVSPSDSRRAQTDGLDIQFSSDKYGATRIACEVVAWEWDSTDGADDAVIEVFVLVPSVSSSVDTDIWMWFNTTGASTQPAVGASYGRNAVWVDYECVWHMEEDPSTTNGTDSTGNANTLTPNGSSVLTLRNGGFGSKGWDFPGADDVDWAETPNSFYDMGIRRAGTVSCWNNNDEDNSQMSCVSDWDTSLGANLRRSSTDSTFYSYPNNHRATGSAVLANGGDELLVGVWDTTTIRVYSAGVEDGQDTLSTDVGSPTPGVHVGVRGDEAAAQDWPGMIDEVRITTNVLSVAHIAADFSNQSTPGTFASSNAIEGPVGCNDGIKMFLDLSLSTPGDESTGYVGIALAATTSGSPDIIHTSSPTTNIFDSVWVWCCNTSAGALDVTFQTATGAGGSRTEITTVSIPAKTGLFLVIPGMILDSGYRIEAFAPTTPSSINVFGFVDRIDQNS